MLRQLRTRAAGAGIPMRVGVEGRLHDPPADERKDAVRGHAENFARTQLAALVGAHQETGDDRAQGHAADCRDAVPLQRLGAGEVGTVMEIVVADARPVDRRHSEADNELAGKHVRAALGQNERIGLAALRDHTAEHGHGHCQAEKYFPHNSPQSLECIARLRGAQSHCSVRCARNTRRGTDSHASRAWLTVQMGKRLSASIWPHLWRNRHKFGRRMRKSPRQVALAAQASRAAETIMKRDQTFGVKSTGT